MQGSFQFLGSGGSMGIPVIGCECSVCTSSQSKNKRLRPSGILKLQDKIFLMDVGPDFRYQALKYKINHIDGLLLTHIHFDHIAGVDELRIYYYRENQKIPCLLSPESLDELKDRYHYLFRPVGEATTISAQLEFQLLEEDGNTSFQGVNIQTCHYFQGNMKVTGYRIGDFAYISDIKEYEDDIFPFLKGVKHLIVSALRKDPSPVHFNIEQAVAFAQKVKPDEAYFTHIAHEMDHDKVSKDLPKGIYLGYDGLTIEFTYDK